MFGWNVSSRFINVLPGRTVTLTLTLPGTLADPGRPLATRVQALNLLPQFTSSTLTDATQA